MRSKPNRSIVPPSYVRFICYYLEATYRAIYVQLLALTNPQPPRGNDGSENLTKKERKNGPLVDEGCTTPRRPLVMCATRYVHIRGSRRKNKKENEDKNENENENYSYKEGNNNEA